jgi:hypothetical protein
MAGHSRREAIYSELAKRTRDTFGEDDEAEVQPTALDYVCQWLENGQTLKALAAEVTSKLHVEVSPALLQRALGARYSQDITERAIDAARSRASHQYAEDALSIVDQPADTQVEVSRAASRARARQWLAEKYNPRAYGSSKDVTVAINIGTLHLAALQAGKPASAMLLSSPASSSDVVVEDAQVVE